MMANVEKLEDHVHVEDLAAPQGYQYVQINPVIEKRVVRKLDWNLVPLVVALCETYHPSPSFAQNVHNPCRSPVFPRQIEYWECTSSWSERRERLHPREQILNMSGSLRSSTSHMRLLTNSLLSYFSTMSGGCPTTLTASWYFLIPVEFCNG
jgi:hypothetical protein